MPLYLLDDELWFPPVEKAMPDGLLAIGGDLGVERLLLAYRNGIFPWYNEDEPPMWWSPDPRFVLFPEELKISKSMERIIKKGEFEFRADTAFEDVIDNCRWVKRKGMDGTWINNDIVTVYTQLYEMGYVHSAEAWQEGRLVGDCMGCCWGKYFSGKPVEPGEQCEQVCVYRAGEAVTATGCGTDRLPGAYISFRKPGRADDTEEEVY